MKILIVDTDSERIRSLKSLESDGHLVQAVETWSEARPLLDRAGFQILALGPQRMEALSEWRQSPAENASPLVVAIDPAPGTQAGRFDHRLQTPLAEKDVSALPGLPAVPPEPVALDQSAAIEICDNDEELFHEITRIFLNAGSQRIENLTRAMEEKNWKNVLEAAHLLKGSALNLAAEPLRVATKYLEKAGGAGDATAIFFWFAQTVYEYGRLEKYLRGLTGGPAEAS